MERADARPATAGGGWVILGDPAPIHSTTKGRAMLSIEQRQDVLDILRADHPDGSFSLQDAIETAASPVVLGEQPAPCVNDVRALLKAWQWRAIIAPAPRGGFRFRRTAGI